MPNEAETGIPGVEAGDMAEIVAVCKSKAKGTKKEAIVEGVLREDYGLIDDAHADW